MVYGIDLLLMWWVVGCIGKCKMFIWYNLVLVLDIILNDKDMLLYFN